MTNKDFNYYEKNQIVFGNVPYTTPVCRLCFPALTAPKSAPPKPGQPAGRPSYQSTLLFPKDSQEHVDFLKLMKVQFNLMLDEYNSHVTDAPLASIKPCLNGDDAKWQTGEKSGKYTFYKGQYVVAARNTDLMPIIDVNGQPCDPKLLHGGVLAKAVITLTVFSRGATYKLRAIQLVKDDGVVFAGGAISNDEFIKMLHTEAPDMAEKANQLEEDLSAGDEPAEDEVEEPTPKTKQAAKPVKKSGKAAIADLL